METGEGNPCPRLPPSCHARILRRMSAQSVTRGTERVECLPRSLASGDGKATGEAVPLGGVTRADSRNCHEPRSGLGRRDLSSRGRASHTIGIATKLVRLCQAPNPVPYFSKLDVQKCVKTRTSTSSNRTSSLVVHGNSFSSKMW